MSGPDINVNEAVDQALPGWMRLLPFQHWRGIAASLASTVDALIDGIFDGRNAALPGQVKIPGVSGLGGFDSVDALPLIGRDRRILRGWTETSWDYAERLRRWRSPEHGWMRAGTAFGLLWQVRTILGPNPPMVRLVQQAHDTTGDFPEVDGGYWHSIEPDGSLVYNTPHGDGFRVNPAGIISLEADDSAPWDWDSATVDDPDMFRVWLIVYAPTNPPLDADRGLWGSGIKWGAIDHATYGSGPHPSPMTWGVKSTLDHVELIRGVALEWKAAGIQLDHIIVAFDPASFDPLTPSPYTDLPDGLWGRDSKSVGGVRVRSRLATARYIAGSKRTVIA